MNFLIPDSFDGKLRELEDLIRLREQRPLPRGRDMNREIRDVRMALARQRGGHTDDEWRALLDEFQGRCVRCGDWGLEKDHIIPIYQGGCDCAQNLQPLCKHCNGSKGPERIDWRQVRRKEASCA